MPRIRALVVGVNEYEEGRLTYAVPDAKSVASTLTQLGADVLLLTDHEATKSKLRDAVEHLCHFERPPMDPSKARHTPICCQCRPSTRDVCTDGIARCRTVQNSPLTGSMLLAKPTFGRLVQNPE